MSALRDWLRENSFEQYADAFEANDIDLDILRGTERARSRTARPVAGKSPAAVEGDRRARRRNGPAEACRRRSADPADAERRQVTVLFCDMVGSTALSGKVDPELLGGLIRRYQDAAAGAIGRFGGFVAKFMGDGVLAYFGFPRAFEDAAERAVRAAIGILAEVGDIELPGRHARSGADRHRHRARRGRRNHRHRHARRSAPSSAKPPISRRGCRRSRRPTPSSSARRRRICSADCSSSNAPASTN